jgi:hypothetical protein
MKFTEEVIDNTTSKYYKVVRLHQSITRHLETKRRDCFDDIKSAMKEEELSKI